MFDARARPCSSAGYQPQSVCCLAQVTLRFPTKTSFMWVETRLMTWTIKATKANQESTSKHLTEQRGTAGFIFTLYSVHVHRIMFYCQTGADLQGSKEGLALPQLPPSPKKIKYVLNILVFANYFFVQKLCFLGRFTFTIHLHITDFHMLTWGAVCLPAQSSCPSFTLPHVKCSKSTTDFKDAPWNIFMLKQIKLDFKFSNFHISHFST